MMRNPCKVLHAVKNTFFRFKILFFRYKQHGFSSSFLDQLIWGADAMENPMLMQPVSLGDKNDGKIVYVIKFPKGWIPTAGFFALLNRTLCGLDYADRMGLIPVIDNWDGCAYEEEEKINGGSTVFEYYFKPTSDISLKEALNSRNVVASTNPNMDITLRETKSEWFHLSDDYIERMGVVYGKYVHLNKTVKEQMEKDMKNVIRGKKMLGIHFRGTDYKLNVNGHPVSLDLDDYFPVIDSALEKYNFDGIFFATDDKKAIDLMRKRYQNIYYYEDVYRGDGNVSVAFSSNSRQNHKYRLGYEVLRDSYTLAACDGLIAGYSQVSVGARINKIGHNERYQFLYIIDKGVNHNSFDWVKYYNENIGAK